MDTGQRPTALLHRHGRRMTRPRQVILDIVRQDGGHLRIEEIYQQVRRQLPQVNRATIYRNLDVLCDLRLLVAADIGGGHWVYESAGSPPHHHLVCRQCGAVVQIGQAEVQALFDQIESSFRFRIDMDHMVLFGLCSNCISREEKEDA